MPQSPLLWQLLLVGFQLVSLIALLRRLSCCFTFCPHAALFHFSKKGWFFTPACDGNRTRDRRVMSTLLYQTELHSGGTQESNLAG
jgi:hypothetical protein